MNLLDMALLEIQMERSHFQPGGNGWNGSVRAKQGGDRLRQREIQVACWQGQGHGLQDEEEVDADGPESKERSIGLGGTRGGTSRRGPFHALL